eukprot:scaffold18793_cov129-Isochrysis_galbana.AAC.1
MRLLAVSVFLPPVSLFCCGCGVGQGRGIGAEGYRLLGRPRVRFPAVPVFLGFWVAGVSIGKVLSARGRQPV